MLEPGRPHVISCCDLGPINGVATVPPPFTYTDVFGFPYHLCARHYQQLARGLRRAAQRTLPDTDRRRGPRRPSLIRRRAGDPRATGAEQRRARTLVGWTLRQLGEALGPSRSQLSAAELGHCPVAPEVARWVRRVLDDVVVEERMEAAG